MSAKMTRRKFLGVAGLGVGSFFLQSLITSIRAEAQTDLPRNAFFMFTGNGTILDQWRPTGTENNFTLSPILAPLNVHKSDLIVVDGITNMGSPGHEGMVGGFLTGNMVNANKFAMGPSIDWVLAQAFGCSLYNLGVRPVPANWGGRITYSGPAAPIMPETDPRTVLDRIFPIAGSPQAKALNLSILDLIKDDLSTLKRRLGASELSKVNVHLEGIREIETEVNGLPSNACSITRPDLPTYDLDDRMQIPKVMKLQMDLICLAFKCGRTRVASLVGAPTGSPANGWTFPFLGINRGYHSISHQGEGQADIDRHVRIQQWYAEQFAYLVTKLKEHALLDQTVAMWGVDFSDANRHQEQNAPYVLAGKCGGYFQTGRYLQLSGGENQTSILTAMANAVGHPVSQFGHTEIAQPALARLR